MTAYLFSRVGHSLLTLFVILTIAFVIIRVAPGGPEVILGGEELSAEDIARFRTSLGLDQPLHVQYFKWMLALVRGDLGRSYMEHRPVLDVIVQRLPNTILLTTTAFVLGLLISIPLGVFSAVKPRSLLDYGITMFTMVGISMPVFWLGILMIIVFAVELRLLPSAGIGAAGEGFDLADRVTHLVMPATVLAFYHLAEWTRYTRASMLDTIGEDYVRTARAKGLPERGVVFKHALRNALIPVVTVIGLSLPGLVGGAAIVETVFAWPGMGRLAVTAAFRRDYPVIMGLLVIFSALVILSNLIIDLLYPYLDPRVRLK